VHARTGVREAIACSWGGGPNAHMESDAGCDRAKRAICARRYWLDIALGRDPVQADGTPCVGITPDARWMCSAVNLRKWLSSTGCGTLRAWSLRKKFATPGHDRIRNIVLPRVVPARVSCLAGGRSQAAAGSRSRICSAG